MNKLVCSIALACVSWTPLLLAEEELVDVEDAWLFWVNEMREQLAFHTWPGKNGALKKGLAFNVADYPALNGWVLSKDEFRLWSLQYGLIREMVLRKPPASPGDALMTITVAVAHGSTDNAHELLLRLGPQHAQSPDPYSRGDQGGIAVGDLNIVHSHFNSRSLVAFARNNVVCTLRCRQWSSPLIDLVALAKEIDAKIKALPDLTPAQFDAARPTITTFEPAKPTIKQIGYYSTDSTTLNIVCSDPSNESLKKILDGGDNVRINSTADPAVVRPAAKPGTFSLKLILVNQSLQYKEATTTISVEDETPVE